MKSGEPLPSAFWMPLCFIQATLLFARKEVMSKESTGYCSSKLYVWGDDLDPKLVTERLGIHPDESWRKGDRERVVRPDGSVRSLDFVHSRRCWRRAIDEERKFWNVSAQLEHWCDLLSSQETAVQELRMYGYKVEIDCYINWGPVVLISIPSDLLKKLGNLGIELSLGFYATEVLAKENSNCEDEPA